MKKNLTAAQIAKRDARREKFAEFVKKVAAMDDSERAEIVERIGVVVNAAGRRLSEGNTMLLGMQCECVSIVGGFAQWLKQGRCVRKGEAGLMLWVPIQPKKGEENAEPVKGEDEKATRQRFMMGTVFDISQTVAIEQEATAAA